MTTINNLISHLTSSDELPFDYNVYEQYVGCLLYLVPLKRPPPRQPTPIRQNVIVPNQSQSKLPES